MQEYSIKEQQEIKLVYFEDEEAMVQLIAHNGRNGNYVPDIACIYSVEIVRNMSDIIYPLSEYVSAEERENIAFWENVTLDGKYFGDSSVILGYPIGGVEVTFMAYNKSIFKAIGIDVESKPLETFDDFMEICDRLSRVGIVPIVGSDGGWNELYLQTFAKMWVQKVGSSKIREISLGQGRFSEDKWLKESLILAQDAYRKGYINKDYATNSNAVTLFINGLGAMFSCSNYDVRLFEKTMGNDFGVFILPDFSGDVIYPKVSFGGCNQCLSVFKSSENKDEAIKIIKWLSTKQNTIRMTQQFGCFPHRKDIIWEEYVTDSDTIEIVKKIYPLIEYAHSTPDYFMPMDVFSEFTRFSLLTILGEMDVEDFTKKMDDYIRTKL